MNLLLEYTDEALAALKSFIAQYPDYKTSWTTKGIEKVLLIIKHEVSKSNKLDNRVLRAMKDVYVVSFRNFEDTELDQAIKKINKHLSTIYNEYDQLEPLGMDFGHGNPI